ncbi:hypothetical protein COC59_31005 [Bacillus cereus]|nr:hypothetical protein COJ45_27930 [Bacillus cereus]PGS18508.1 hypothetical protein COC59_31005 [Bacillus cereus]
MDDPIKEIVGAWFVAVGTIIAAIGSTPLKRLNSELRKDLSVWGNVLQATGNGLEVFEVLRAHLGIINKSPIKNSLGCKRIFYWE